MRKELNFEDLLDRLFDYYNVSSIIELAEKMGVTQPSISNWKSRNSINAIKKKCRDLGIYKEIFADNEEQAEIRINASTKKLIQDLRGLGVSEDELQVELFKLIQKYSK